MGDDWKRPILKTHKRAEVDLNGISPLQGQLSAVFSISHGERGNQ